MKGSMRRPRFPLREQTVWRRVVALVWILAGCRPSGEAVQHEPVIAAFEASPAYGDAPVSGLLYWRISDEDGDTLTCELDLDGDGEAEESIRPCTSQDVYNFAFQEVGKHTVTLTVSDGKSTVSKDTVVYANHCPFKDGVKQPEKVTGFMGGHVVDDKLVLQFEDPSVLGDDREFEIHNGDVLVGASAGGYAVRVTGLLKSVSADGVKYYLKTEPVTLTDLFEECVFGARDVVFPMSNLKCTENCEHLTDISYGNETTGPKGGVSFTAKLTFDEVEFDDNTKWSQSITLGLALKNLELEIRRGEVEKFHIEVEPKLTLAEKLEVTVGGKQLQQELSLGKIPIGTFWIGPILFTPTFETYVEAELDVRPKFTFQKSATVKALGVVHWTRDNGLETRGDITIQANPLQYVLPKLDLLFVKVSLKPVIALKVYGLAGPFVGPSAYLQGTADADLATGKFCLKAKVGADAKYGARLDFLGLHLDAEKTKVGVSYTIASKCWQVPFCGNGKCDQGEDCTNCPVDCQHCCGDGVVDESQGETCDPPDSCPEDCDDRNPCTRDSLEGSVLHCTARCVHEPVTQCVDGDRCCPAGCTNATDSDCTDPGLCGNGRLDPGETCDPPAHPCPTSCDDGDPCTRDSSSGSAAECNLECHHAAITSCVSGDGCCPSQCGFDVDSDCPQPDLCGNGVVDPGEYCDGNCPTDCSDGDACTRDTLLGDARDCTARCVHETITACTGGDGCCPAGCTHANDSDCAAGPCPDGVCAPDETTATCPQDCDGSDPCQAVVGPGHWCGATDQFPLGTSGVLYYCSTSHVTLSTQVCQYGCHEAPPGLNDYCESAPLGEYLDSCTDDSQCGASAPYCLGGVCCIGSGGIEPGEACGRNDNCCSGHCSNGICCLNAQPPGCMF